MDLERLAANEQGRLGVWWGSVGMVVVILGVSREYGWLLGWGKVSSADVNPGWGVWIFGYPMDGTE